MIDFVEKAIVDEIRELVKENNLLRNWIKEGNEQPVCVVCGKPIKNISLQRMARPFHWHNRACFTYKPKTIISIEKTYGLDIVDILIETTKRYGNIKVQCQALDISVPSFYSIIRRYCGNYLEFMATHSTGKRKTYYAQKLKESKEKAATE